MFTRHLRTFAACHIGAINLVLHAIGFALIGIGIITKSLTLVLVGAAIQELGHWHQFAQTRDPKQSPWHCLKPQWIFAYPLLGLIMLYIVFAR